jgi:hypothetical protein
LLVGVVLLDITVAVLVQEVYLLVQLHLILLFHTQLLLVLGELLETMPQVQEAQMVLILFFQHLLLLEAAHRVLLRGH